MNALILQGFLILHLLTCSAAVTDFKGIQNKDTGKNIVFSEKESRDLISGFAVSENGCVAVNLSNYHINVYNNELEFLYSLDFDPAHCTQIVSWEGETLLIYRKNSVKFECTAITGADDASVYEIPLTEENLTLWNDLYENRQNEVIETDAYTYRFYDGKLSRISKETAAENVITEDSAVSVASWQFTEIIFGVLFIILCIVDWRQKHKKTEQD